MFPRSPPLGAQKRLQNATSSFASFLDHFWLPLELILDTLALKIAPKSDRNRPQIQFYGIELALWSTPPQNAENLPRILPESMPRASAIRTALPLSFIRHNRPRYACTSPIPPRAKTGAAVLPPWGLRLNIIYNRGYYIKVMSWGLHPRSLRSQGVSLLAMKTAYEHHKIYSTTENNHFNVLRHAPPRPPQGKQV